MNDESYQQANPRGTKTGRELATSKPGWNWLQANREEGTNRDQTGEVFTITARKTDLKKKKAEGLNRRHFSPAARFLNYPVAVAKLLT